MGEWCSKARLLTRAALRLRRKLLPRILEQQPAPQERAGESAFYASPPTSATNDNNRSVSFKCLSNFPALGFLIVSMLPAIYVPKRAETFRVMFIGTQVDTMSCKGADSVCCPLSCVFSLLFYYARSSNTSLRGGAMRGCASPCSIALSTVPMSR